MHHHAVAPENGVESSQEFAHDKAAGQLDRTILAEEVADRLTRLERDLPVERYNDDSAYRALAGSFIVRAFPVHRTCQVRCKRGK